MAFLGETLDVIQQGFALLLSSTHQIPGISGSHVCALEVAGKDLPEILPAINQVSGQVIEPSSIYVSQVDGEELDNE
jgi:hypothetical protein